MNKSKNGKLYIIPTGTIGWGQYVNSNFDSIDEYITNLENEVLLLKNENQILPIKLSNAIGHNLLKNPLFNKVTIVDPTTPTDWDYYLLNGASGYKSRSSDTIIIGGSSLKLSIISSNISSQENPYGNFPVYYNSEEVDKNFDTENLLLRNNIYIAKQRVYLLPNTYYTFSAYGKVDIINQQLNIGVCWQLAVVIKDGNEIKECHVTKPKYNNIFERNYITIKTKNQTSRVEAEVWLINKSINQNSIGSAFFTAVQLEHSSTVTDFDEIVTPTVGSSQRKYDIYGDLEIHGNFTISQNELVFNQNKTLFKNRVLVGDENTYNDTLLIVNTKKTIFERGDIQIFGNVSIENNTNLNIKSTKVNIKSDDLNVKVDVDINGNITITDNLKAKNISTEILDTKDCNITKNLSVGSNILNENSLTYSHKIFAPNKFVAGTWLESIVWVKDYNNSINNKLLNDVGNSFLPFGSLIVDGDLRIGRGNNKIVADVKECNLIDTTLNVGDGANIFGNTVISNDKSKIELNENINITTDNNFILNTKRFNIDSSLSSKISVDNFTIGRDNITSNSNLDIKFKNINIYGDLNISGKTLINNNINVKNIISDGYLFDFNNNFVLDLNSKTLSIGNNNSLLNSININVKDLKIGYDYNQIESNGNVEIFGDLSIHGDINLGVDGNNLVNCKAKVFNIDSDVHIGGGYDYSRTFNYNNIDHGGVSIYKNGNVLLNGSLVAGNAVFNSYVILSKLEDSENKVVFEIDREVVTNNIKYAITKAYIDNTGYAYFNKVYTAKSSNSNLASYSVTVGDGIESFGDFNGENAIINAINYLNNNRYTNNRGGVIFVKSGIYDIKEDININDNIKIIGEGVESTILIMNNKNIRINSNSEISYMTIKNANKILVSGDKNKISSLGVDNIIDGIVVEDGKQNIITNNWINNSQNGIITNNLLNIISNNVLKNTVNNLNIGGNIINDNNFVLLNGVINNLIIE